MKSKRCIKACAAWMAVLILTLSAGLAFAQSENQMRLTFEPDGTAVMENSLVRLRITGRPTRVDGIRGWVFKPTGYDMVDVLYRAIDAEGGHLGGLNFDRATVGSLPVGLVDVGSLYAPLFAGLSEDGRAVVLEQVAQEAYSLTRTIIVRRDLAAVEMRIRIENVRAEPRAFAFRMHNVLSPGARGQYQSRRDIIYLPGRDGPLAWHQGLPLDEFKAANAGFAIFEAEKEFLPTLWSARVTEATPRMQAPWIAHVNPENGNGMALIMKADEFLGFYNHPATTVEPVFRATGLQRGESWETSVFFSAFGGAGQNAISGACPFYVETASLTHAGGKLRGAICPAFQGTLVVTDGGGRQAAEYEALLLKPILLDAAVAADWILIARDTQGAELGRVHASGNTTVFEPGIVRKEIVRPQVVSDVYRDSAHTTAIKDALLAGDCVVQVDPGASAPVLEMARAIAVHLGLGFADESMYSGKMIAFGEPGTSAMVRNVGLLKHSVNTNWPGRGKGAIMAYDHFESTSQPLILVAGSDADGALAAARLFHREFVASLPKATGFAFWTAPVSDLAMRWSRPVSVKDAPQRIGITSARDEYESAQVILTAYEDLTGIEITADPLIHKETGEEISRRFLTPTQRRMGPLTVRFADTYPLERVANRVNYPDPLLYRPVTAMKAGQSQVIWITTIVASDARPGDYTGAIHVTIGNQKQTIPLDLHVNDFNLPLTGVKGEAYMQMNAMAPEGRQLRRFEIDNLIRSLVEHRFRIISLTEPDMIRWHISEPGAFTNIALDFTEVNEDGTLMMDASRFQELFEMCESAAKPFDLDYNVYALTVLDWPQFPALFEKAFPERYAGKPERQGHKTNSYHTEEMLTLFRRYLERKGMLDRFTLKVGDEPPGFDYWWNQNSQAALNSGLTFNTAFNSIDWGQAERALGTRFGRFKPLYQSFDPEFARRAQAAGHEVGFYNCGPPPRTTAGTGASELRGYYWQGARYDVDFISRWGVQCWYSEGTHPMNLWNYRYSSMHSLVYPEHPEKGVYRVQGFPQRDIAPLDSIRYELVRDGHEDADYVWLLRRLIERAAKEGRAAAEAAAANDVLEDIWKDLFPSLNHYNPPYAALMAARERVAGSIVRLQSAFGKPQE